MINKMKILYFLLIIALFASCKQPTKQANEEKTSTENQTANPSVQPVAFNVVKINIAKSELKWLGSTPTKSHNGTVGIREGVIFTDSNGLIRGGKVILDMNQINVTDIKDKADNADLVDHLKNQDFFEVSTYPTADFSLNSVKIVPNGSTTMLDGTLTIKGKTLPISPEGVVSKNGNIISISSKFNIDRTQWGITYKSKTIDATLKDKFLNDIIELEINLVTE